MLGILDVLKVKDIDVCLLPATPFGSPMHANPWLKFGEANAC